MENKYVSFALIANQALNIFKFLKEKKPWQTYPDISQDSVRQGLLLILAFTRIKRVSQTLTL